MDELDGLINKFKEFTDSSKDDDIDKNSKAIGAGAGAIIGYAALQGAEASIAAEAGVAIGAALGIGTIAAPLMAIGIGYLTYKVVGGFARKAIREIDHQIESKNKIESN